MLMTDEFVAEQQVSFDNYAAEFLQSPVAVAVYLSALVELAVHLVAIHRLAAAVEFLQ